MSARPPQLETIEILLDGGVATVLLNRPGQRNAWTLQMSEDMSAALAWCDQTRKGSGEFFLYELFRDRRAFELHQRNEALNTLGRQLAELADNLVVTSGRLLFARGKGHLYSSII